MAAFVSKRYSYSVGYHSKVKAQTVGKALEEIEKSGTEVTAQSFLDYSRDEASETHDMFEWDDSVAAEKYRLSQATNIICHLEVTEEWYENEPTEVELEERSVEPSQSTYFKSAYVNVAQRSSVSQKANYVPLKKALNDDEMRMRVLDNALMSLHAFERSYAFLEEMALVIDAIHKTDDAVNKTRSEKGA